MEIEKVCKICGLWFVAKHHKQVYCSDVCRLIGKAQRSAACYKRKTKEKIQRENPKALKGGKMCLVCGKPLKKKQAKYCSVKCANRASTDRERRKGTLCWHCEWACGKDGHCLWARSLTPVPGWVAKKTYLKIGKDAYTDSYIVKECPLYSEG